MKKQLILILLIAWFIGVQAYAQEIVSDFDGNAYNTVVIGEQTWLKENLKSLHYSDGAEIPDVVAYNNDETQAEIFGRLYTWDATVRTTGQIITQGVCPTGWHVPTSAEYTQLENFLGGADVAGGKMKDTTEGMWISPNVGATNSSGFTALPAGEYDAHEFIRFQYLHEYAVFWTATQINTLKAKERYISAGEAGCLPYNWYKVMKYSVRCVKDLSTGLYENKPDRIPVQVCIAGNFLLLNSSSDINASQLKLFDLNGRLLLEKQNPSANEKLDVSYLQKGVYIVSLKVDQQIETYKVIKT